MSRLKSTLEAEKKLPHPDKKKMKTINARLSTLAGERAVLKSETKEVYNRKHAMNPKVLGVHAYQQQNKLSLHPT